MPRSACLHATVRLQHVEAVEQCLRATSGRLKVTLRQRPVPSLRPARCGHFTSFDSQPTATQNFRREVSVLGTPVSCPGKLLDRRTRCPHGFGQVGPCLRKHERQLALRQVELHLVRSLHDDMFASCVQDWTCNRGLGTPVPESPIAELPCLQQPPSSKCDAYICVRLLKFPCSAQKLYLK